MARLVSSVSDVLDTLQKERGSTRPRLKADLQRAPARGARPRGCSNGEGPGRGMCLGLLWTGLCLRIREGGNHLRREKPAWGRDLIQRRGWEGDWRDGAGGRWKVMFQKRCSSPCSPQLSINQPAKPAAKPLCSPADSPAPHTDVAGAEAEQEATVWMQTAALHGPQNKVTFIIIWLRWS